MQLHNQGWYQCILWADKSMVSECCSGVDRWHAVTPHSSHCHVTVTHRFWFHIPRADSSVAPSQWETALLCNDVSHWLSATLESGLYTTTMTRLNTYHTWTHERHLISHSHRWAIIMMTSSNGNIFCVTGPLWGESTSHRWISLTKACDTELWCFPSSVPEQTVEQTIKTGDLRCHFNSVVTVMMMFIMSVF